MAWEQMTSIIVEAVGYARYEKSEPPLACPFDGEPLRESPNGTGRYCPLGDYDWPRMPRLI